MSVDPDSGELLGPSPCIVLLIKQVGDRFIVEGNVSPGADLRDQLEILDQQQVVGGGDSKSADLGRPAITQEQQLRPGGRAESEYWRRTVR